jgi:hypothetical protein
VWVFGPGDGAPLRAGARDNGHWIKGIWRDALSGNVLETLQHGFRHGSSYWGPGREGYKGDYYSHWYHLRHAPMHAIHQAIQQLAMAIPAEDRARIRGTEQGC